MNHGIEEQLNQDGVYVSTTVGWSMFPMLRNRHDRVIICPVGNERLKKYDLPLYRRPDGKYVLHRIIGVRQDCYVIRGDNTYRREYVPDQWVIGYVSEFYRNGRHYQTDARGYRIYAAVWNFLFPIRWAVFQVARVFLALRRKLRRKKETK